MMGTSNLKLPVPIEKVREAAEARRDEITQFMIDVVSIKSLSCGEKEVVQRVAEEMRKVGFDEVIIDEMGNCLGRIGSGNTVLLMDAHVDTVDIGDPDEWERPPYPATLEDGVIYGRGAADQKGGIVGLVYGGALIKDLGLENDYTMWVLASTLEEDSDGIALLHVLREDSPIKPDFCVVTDSTDMNLYRGQRGRMEIVVTVKGKSCHGSMPEKGDNPVTKAADIVKEIDELNHRLKVDEFLGKGTICVSNIEAKTPSLCAVPAECSINLDRRLTWGETPEGAVEQIQALPSVQKAKTKVEILQYNVTTWTGLDVGQEKFYPTWKFEENHPLVQVGAEAASAALGKQVKIDRWVFSTNGVACAGRLGIPTIGFGPGEEAVAHTVHEYCKVDDLVTHAVFSAVFPWMMAESRK